MRVRKHIMLRNTRGNKFARVCTFNEELFKFLNIHPGANLQNFYPNFATDRFPFLRINTLTDRFATFITVIT